MSYGGLDGAIDQSVPHLGGNIRGGDPYTYCPSVWSYLIDRFCLSSVLDLGSGAGNAAEYFFRKGMRVVAVEGLRQSVERSIYPAVQHDLTQAPICTSVDLVHCQEVVEHIEAAYLPHLLASLGCGKFCVMTHAVPDQPGYHHVNLQPSEYWVEHMRAQDCVLLEADTARVRALAERDGAIYMTQTGLVFANRRRY